MATAFDQSAPAQFAANDAAERLWFTAAELAELALPGLPGDKRSINRRAQDERWTSRSGPDGALLVRPRAGRGGGVEFHVTLLPGEARLELSRRGITAAQGANEPAPEIAAGGWRWFEGQVEHVRREAARRLGIVQEIELLCEAGCTRTAAIAAASGRHAVGKATLWQWLALVEGVAAADRLPALAPRRKGGGREAEIDPFLWRFYRSDVLRLSGASLTSCYDRTAEKARELGLSLPCEKTFRRRLKRDVDPAVFKLAREGEEALRRSVPAQRRTVEHLRAMEVVNIDGHKFDVWVIPPEGGDPVRPIMVAIQDVRSSKIVGWRLGKTESTALARLAVADMIRDFGIPDTMTCDNGRGFASKWFTGGIANRFRFTVCDDEPTGLLVALGIKVNWALPGRGQSKPIERAFRDLSDTISCAPACEGAYTGPNPLKKPENYRSKAIGWADFHAHVARGIARHNAKPGRRGRRYRGRSFDQVFADTFVEIKKASPEQLRLALLAHEQVRVNRQNGEVTLFGNRYWADGCNALGGQRVTVRFDPDNLHGPVHLYDTQGRFLLTAELIADSPWGTADGAKATAKRAADYRRRAKLGLEAEQLLSAEALAAIQADSVPAQIAEPQIVVPVRHRGQTAAQLKPKSEARADEAVRRESRVFGALRLVGGDD